MRSQRRTRVGFIDPCFQQCRFEGAFRTESFIAKRVRHALVTNAHWCDNKGCPEGGVSCQHCQYLSLSRGHLFRRFAPSQERDSLHDVVTSCCSEDWLYLCQKSRTIREPRFLISPSGRSSQQAGEHKSHGLNSLRKNPALSAMARTSAILWSDHRALALLIMLCIASSIIPPIEQLIIAICTSDGQVEMGGTEDIAAGRCMYWRSICSSNAASATLPLVGIPTNGVLSSKGESVRGTAVGEPEIS